MVIMFSNREVDSQMLVVLSFACIRLHAVVLVPFLFFVNTHTTLMITVAGLFHQQGASESLLPAHKNMYLCRSRGSGSPRALSYKIMAHAAPTPPARRMITTRYLFTVGAKNGHSGHGQVTACVNIKDSPF